MQIFHAVNPATGESLEPSFRESTIADVDSAFIAAEHAFARYRLISGRERAGFLRRIAREIESVSAELTARAHAETALPLVRLEGERARTVNQLGLIADAVEEGSWVQARIDRADPTRTPLPRPDVRRLLVPLGPVAVFGASNFPLAFGAAGNDTVAALGAGCTVVYKAHPAQPGTSRIIAGAIERAISACNMPAGVFSMLHGWSTEVGLAMVQHPSACAVGFTGSLRGGRALFDAAAARPEPIPVFAEMGSINPVFVFPSVVRERRSEVARMLAQSVTQGVGQFCTNPGVIVAVRDEKRSEQFDAFRDELAQLLADAASGVPLYARLGESYVEGIDRAKTAGARVTHEAGARDGVNVRAALLLTDGQQFVEQRELREEIFGPVSLLVQVSDVEEFTRVAHAIEGQLTATLFASPDELADHRALIQQLERKVGRLVLNSVPTGVEVSAAMHHGGPYPASTDSRTTSIGTASIDRFARPVCYQGFPALALPEALRDTNPLGIWRLVDGALTRVGW